MVSKTPETDALFYELLKKMHTKEDVEKIWSLVCLSRKFEKQVTQMKEER